MEIMNMNSAFRDTVRVIIRLTMGGAGADPTTGEPG